MACEDDDPVATVLEANSRIDNEPLGTSDTKVWVEKDNRLLLGL